VASATALARLPSFFRLLYIILLGYLYIALHHFTWIPGISCAELRKNVFRRAIFSFALLAAGG
jgi:hypothetical protein